MFTTADHIRELIESGRAIPLSVETSVAFGKYIESLPLLLPLGASVDWSKMPHFQAVSWHEKSDEELLEWARTLRIGKFNKVVVWYNEREPCLLSEFNFGVANMDVFTWKAPGARYLFGAELVGEGYHFSFDALVEVTGGKLIYGVV